MTQTTALFYPTIDINDDSWLKSSILFWDQIRTIVPEGINDPYKTDLSKELAKQHILMGEPVNPASKFVKGVSEDMLKYLNTPEGFNQLNVKPGEANNISEQYFNVHRSKFSDAIFTFLEDNLVADNWVRLDSRLSGFYMTLLANKISEGLGLSLLTNESMSFALSNIVKLDNVIDPNKAVGAKGDQKKELPSFGQALLTNFIVEKIKISANVSLKDLLNFKHKHQDELENYRNNLDALTKDFKATENFESDQQRIQDTYTTKFVPAYNDFEKSLKGSGIKAFTKDSLKISAVSVPLGSIPLALLHMATPLALVAVAGFSAVASIVSYKLDRKKEIRSSPYSYLYNLYKGV